MKRCRRFLAILLCFSMVWIPVSANGMGTTVLLEQLAEEHIQKTVNGNEVTYSNLQGFIAEAVEQFPDLDSLELAKFTMTYTNLSGVDTLPNEEILGILEAQEITSVTQHFAVDDEGVIHEVNPLQIVPYWTSSDGMVEITTSVIRGGTNYNGYREYTVSADLNWLNMPLQKIKDTLAIAYTGAYDSTKTIVGSYTWSGNCGVCGNNYSVFNRDIYGNDDYVQNDPKLEIDTSQLNAIGIKFEFEGYPCFHTIANQTHDYTEDTQISAHLNFHILVDSLGEVRSAYAHPFVGLGRVSIGASVGFSDGKLQLAPQFNFEGILAANQYTAVPMTVQP